MSKETTKLTPRQRKGIVEDLARAKPNMPGRLEEIADAWEVPKSTVAWIQRQQRGAIAEIREAVAENGMAIAAVMDVELVKKLNNPDEMKATSIRDLSQARKNMVDSSIVAAEGNSVNVKIDYGKIMAVREALRNAPKGPTLNAEVMT